MSASSIILGILTIAAYALSLLGFLGKGIIIDDHYVFSTREKRKDMDKEAYYLQSGILFLCLGTMFLVYLLRLITGIRYFTYIALFFTFVAMVYAIISHYRIKKQ